MKKLSAFFLLAFLLVSCVEEFPSGNHSGPVPEETVAKPGEYLLPVVETTDIHGYIVETEGTVLHYRMAYVADRVKKFREGEAGYDKDRLLLLDGGDIYQGASISNLLNGRPVYTSVDMMDYDAVALGNHEFDWGIENLVDPDATLPDYEWKGRTVENLVPVVCANLYQDGARVSCTRDYVIVEKKAFDSEGGSVPVKIGIIGFAVNYAGSIMYSKFSGNGYSIKENYSIAENIASELESSGQCDATILLIHGDAESVANSMDRNSVIDLVLGGHSHGYMYGETAWNLPYIQGGRFCEHYACANLVFAVTGDGEVSFKSIQNKRILDVDANYDRDPSYLDKDILAVSDAALADISVQLEDVIGYIGVGATKYSISGSGGRSSTMGNWMCDITRRIGNADVAFENGGGIRTEFPLNGKTRNITVADVYDMFPFGNAIYVYRITYEELLSVLAYSLTNGGASQFSRMTGIDCYYDSRNTVHKLVKDGTVIYQDYAWVGDWASRTVTMAVNEYVATFVRTDYNTGLPNPLPGWNETSRLLENGQIDNESAVRVLREEAAASNGLLWVDTATHYIPS